MKNYLQHTMALSPDCQLIWNDYQGTERARESFNVRSSSPPESPRTFASSCCPPPPHRPATWRSLRRLSAVWHPTCKEPTGMDHTRNHSALLQNSNIKCIFFKANRTPSRKKVLYIEVWMVKPLGTHLASNQAFCSRFCFAAFSKAARQNLERKAWVQG